MQLDINKKIREEVGKRTRRRHAQGEEKWWWLVISDGRLLSVIVLLRRSILYTAGARMPALLSILVGRE